MIPSRTVAVVDADGIGAHLPGALARQGLGSVVVRSDTPDGVFSDGAGGGGADLVHTGDVTATAEALREHGVDFVVAGTESGVLLADALSAALGTPGNGMARPAARRDKYAMAQAVAAAGLATAASLVTGSLPELRDWVHGRGEWPVVLKPRASAGTDQVHFCHSAEQLDAAFAGISAATDRYGGRNTTVLAQQYLRGEEYFVNTVSRGGAHHVVEVWRYHKSLIAGTVPMYDYEEPVPPGAPGVQQVTEYALAVLDALEIHNGAAHTEVMLTAGGPVLVECAARPGGAHAPEVVSRCLGTNQIDLLAQVIARPGDLTDGTLPRYRIDRPLRYVSLISEVEGVIPDAGRLAPVRALPSFTELVLAAPEGAAVHPTVDLGSSPGYVYLSAPDAGQVEADYRRLRELERAGLYEAPVPTAADAR
ncbi:ATP-grasp domain-containing protein [Streptomyces sp. NPDC048514]|uniref:ATP-grasp domain-containing protein n=1 Tax=Streptomyces sp. NPDC048514 TaxID=3365564 RepID=UPI003723F2F9